MARTSLRRRADRALGAAMSVVAVFGTLLLIGCAVSVALLAMVLIATLVIGGA